MGLSIQEIFDKVVGHLRDQGKKSSLCTNDGVTCLYRHPEGLKCAAGCLMKDEYYYQAIEGKNVESWIVQDILKVSGVDMDDDNIFSLVKELQSFHDFTSPTLWKTNFKEIAKIHGVIYTEVS